MDKNINAVKLGSIKSKKKAGSSAENGRKGGRPPRHGLSNTKFYKKWYGINERCSSPKRKHYHNKGIKVEWQSFEEFKEDMYESYLEHIAIHGERKTTIDRIDNDGNYSKENCRWATWKEQANNKTTNVFLTKYGKTQTITQWSDEAGISTRTMFDRKYKGHTNLFDKVERTNLHANREREVCEFQGCTKMQEKYGVCKKCGHRKYARYCSRHCSPKTRLLDSDKSLTPKQDNTHPNQEGT